jgi:hypothetical protein
MLPEGQGCRTGAAPKGRTFFFEKKKQKTFAPFGFGFGWEDT